MGQAKKLKNIRQNFIFGAISDIFGTIIDQLILKRFFEKIKFSLTTTVIFGGKTLNIFNANSGG